MKVFCPTCGCHFPDEFDDTLRETCGWWEDRGFPASFPNRYREQIWKAVFGAIDADIIRAETGVSVTINFGAIVNDEGHITLEEQIPGYRDWDEQKRRAFQRRYALWSRDEEARRASWMRSVLHFVDEFDQEYTDGTPQET